MALADKILTSIVIIVFWCAFAYLILHKWCEFTVTQSIVLGFMAYFAARNTASRVNIDQSVLITDPFLVNIKPKWKDISLDFSLVDGEDGWKQLQESYAEKTRSLGHYDALLDDFRFTVLEQGVQSSLLFWHNRSQFVMNWDFREELMSLRQPDAVDWSCAGGYVRETKMYMRLVEKEVAASAKGKPTPVRVVEIGIITPASYRAANDPKAYRANPRQGEIALAWLPVSLFDDYQRYKIRYGIDERHHAVMTTLGWEYAEAFRPWALVEHKYFEVSCRRI